MGNLKSSGKGHVQVHTNSPHRISLDLRIPDDWSRAILPHHGNKAPLWGLLPWIDLEREKMLRNFPRSEGKMNTGVKMTLS